MSDALISYIFSLVAKSDMPLALYFGKAKVILNKSLTCRKANITAQQYNLSLDKYHKSACGFI